MATITLSKSTFLKGLQCHKSLWLNKSTPDLKTPPDASTQALFNMGQEVGKLAQKLFPEGKAILFEVGDFDQKLAQTQEYIKSGVQTIYEATFRFNGVLVMVDILHKEKRGWEFYEVKATTHMKDTHIDDVAIQYYVLKGSGLNIKAAILIHINNQYVRHGDLELDLLFSKVNLTTQAIEKQDWVAQGLKSMKSILKKDQPDIDIGPHCTDPYNCDFIDHCWSHIPENSVFDLTRLHADKKFELYYQGIMELNDLPEDYPLSEAQKMQVEAELNGKIFIDPIAIQKFLGNLYYPMYFLDFETFQQAIPEFEGIKPYQQIPFQYSLHFKQKKDGKLNHKEFLAQEGIDPRESIAKSLADNIPSKVCILTYNSGFEKRVLRELADQVPKYRGRLMEIHDQIQDLMVPFQRKYLYNREMKGSHSIKYVLPALIPDLNYSDLEISGGRQASSIYSTLHLEKNKRIRNQIRKNLLEYCKLDTLGMVEILKYLEENGS